MNRCFRKVPREEHDPGRYNPKGSKGGYWAIDMEELAKTNFGKHIIEHGFASTIEYWQQEQYDHQRLNQQLQQQYHIPLAQPHPRPATHYYSRDEYTTHSDERLSPFYARLSNRRNSAFSTVSSKTSSVRDSSSVSPRSISTAEFDHAPTLSNAHRIPPIQHPQKLNTSHTHFNPLMRVNNILN